MSVRPLCLLFCQVKSSHSSPSTLTFPPLLPRVYSPGITRKSTTPLEELKSIPSKIDPGLPVHTRPPISFSPIRSLLLGVYGSRVYFSSLHTNPLTYPQFTNLVLPVPLHTLLGPIHPFPVCNFPRVDVLTTVPQPSLRLRF